MTASELTCQELAELVTDYFEEKLSPATHARFEAHLSTCPGCRIYLEQMRQTIGVLGTLSEETMPTQAREVLLALFHDWKTGGRQTSNRRPRRYVRAKSGMRKRLR